MASKDADLLKLDPPESVLVRQTPRGKRAATGGGDGAHIAAVTADSLRLSMSSRKLSGSMISEFSDEISSPLSTMRMSQGKTPGIDERQVLNCILPVQKWTDDAGIKFSQKVSSTPAIPSDVVALQAKLDRALRQQQARETGLCPIRSRLYSQTFDELIRQVTISNLETGLVLLRVRNELRMTTAAYQRVYESALAYGMRRALQTELLKKQLAEEIRQSEEDIKSLTEGIATMHARAEMIQQEAAGAREAEQQRHEQEVAALTEIRDTLTRDLDEILNKKSY